MTSKEALNSIADKYAIKEYDKDGNLIKWAGTIDKEYLTIMKDLEILDILRTYLKQVVHIKETSGGLEMSFKPTTFYIAKVMDLDFNFNDTENIKNIRKVKEWLDNDK